MSNPKAESKMIRIKLVKSGIGFPGKQKKVIQGLGFSRLNQVISRPDTPQTRGMIFKIKHLVEVVNE